jgi:hypothetical protein
LLFVERTTAARGNPRVSRVASEGGSNGEPTNLQLAGSAALLRTDGVRSATAAIHTRCRSPRTKPSKQAAPCVSHAATTRSSGATAGSRRLFRLGSSGPAPCLQRSHACGSGADRNRGPARRPVSAEKWRRRPGGAVGRAGAFVELDAAFDCGRCPAQCRANSRSAWL